MTRERRGENETSKRRAENETSKRRRENKGCDRENGDEWNVWDELYDR